MLPCWKLTAGADSGTKPSTRSRNSGATISARASRPPGTSVSAQPPTAANWARWISMVFGPLAPASRTAEASSPK